MRVLIWATSLQADILAIAAHLDRCPDVELLVVTPRPANFLRQPYAKKRPLRAPLIDRDDPQLSAYLRRFNADVAVADNHFPPRGSAPRLAFIFHGHGWKNTGPADLWSFYKKVALFTGIDPRRPNPRFFALCFGETDRAWRVERWGLHPDCCKIVGMAFSDLLLSPPYSREELAPHYTIDIRNRKTVLFCLTWHYGGVFAVPASLRQSLQRRFGGTGERARDFQFVELLARELAARDANLLMCMHDRHRYKPEFLHELDRVVSGHPHVQVKFKDENPDNLADLLVADVMISNYSSFLSQFYILRRPVIHVRPVTRTDLTIEMPMIVLGKLWSRRSSGERGAWMIDLNDTGGPIVNSAEEALTAAVEGLQDPLSCAASTQAWLDRHLFAPDGHTAARFKAELDVLCASHREARAS